MSARHQLSAGNVVHEVPEAGRSACCALADVATAVAATTTLDGRYLPPPPPKFTGQIELNAAQSKPAWPARVVPPKDAPNILLIMTDDDGFAAPSTFGGSAPSIRRPVFAFVMIAASG